MIYKISDAENLKNLWQWIKWEFNEKKLL